MQNEPNFNQRAEFTRRSFGGRFARPNTQTVQILLTKSLKNSSTLQNFVSFSLRKSPLSSTFPQKYSKKRELLPTFLYFAQTFYAKQTQSHSGIYHGAPELIYSYTHSLIYSFMQNKPNFKIHERKHSITKDLHKYLHPALLVSANIADPPMAESIIN
jgi:hypothetical protein